MRQNLEMPAKAEWARGGSFHASSWNRRSLNNFEQFLSRGYKLTDRFHTYVHD